MPEARSQFNVWGAPLVTVQRVGSPLVTVQRVGSPRSQFYVWGAPGRSSTCGGHQITVLRVGSPRSQFYVWGAPGHSSRWLPPCLLPWCPWLLGPTYYYYLAWLVGRSGSLGPWPPLCPWLRKLPTLQVALLPLACRPFSGSLRPVGLRQGRKPPWPSWPQQECTEKGDDEAPADQLRKQRAAFFSKGEVLGLGEA